MHYLEIDIRFFFPVPVLPPTSTPRPNPDCVSLCNYVVRFINPQRKSDYKVRNWHNVHERFTTPRAVREKLTDCFNEHVPETMFFEIGYYEKPGNSKRWIENPEDLKAMYKSYRRNDETIMLWCDGRNEGSCENVQKRKSSSDSNDGPQNKRSKRENEIETAFRTLSAKHSEFSDLQLRLWARMFVNGLHNDLESPPNVPAITGQPVKRKRDDHSHNLTEAIAGAATAITKVLAGSQRPTTPPSCSTRPSTGISPASKASLSGQYL